MDMFTGMLVGLGVYCAYKMGQISQKNIMANESIKAAINKIQFPACVAEKIDGHYYLYEKDTTN